MNIILLSGGSGKRLWPLSNEVRSKQFLKLFSDGEGNRESMVQRVFRQIRKSMPDAKITIATSYSQKSSILNQLGEKVDICFEPCRRDTFPAIALTAAYLKDVKGVGEEEAVVICPVDPYVQDSYYRAVQNMEAVILQDTAKITLLGITPTYPSEKYGYVLRENDDPVAPVRAYREKPTMEKAREYLREGALWNAGVFGCKLGYLLEKAHEQLNFTDYNDLFAHFEDATKISFDYAVAEKESSIQVMPYTGQWRDIGTWNMISEVMDEAIIGNGMMDDTCQNTHIVNELGIPLLCMGMKNVIVAASPDGILVSDKYQSGYMKPYVEKLSVDVRYQEKAWGTFQIIDEQDHNLTAKETLKAGGQTSYHSHAHRDEVITVLSGEGIFVRDGQKTLLHAGDTVSVHIGEKHMIIAKTNMQVIEVQMGSAVTAEDRQIFEYDMTEEETK